MESRRTDKSRAVVTKEFSGFVFTKRQPLQEQQSRGGSNIVNLEKESKRILKHNELNNSENQTEQYATMETLMNAHDSTSTPTSSSSKMKRRSSLGLRGKRNVNGVSPSPHQSIAPANFYALIDAELSDPLRMKQLLTWCAAKTMEEYPFEKKSPVDLIVHKIQNQVLNGLIDKTLNTSWYQREDIIGNSPQTPHPNNIENSKNVSLFKDQLAQLESELKEWTEITKKHQDNHAKHLDQYDPLCVQHDTITSMVDKEFAVFLEEIDQVCQESDLLVQDFNQNTLFKVHALEHLLHQSHVTSDDMSRSCEHLYSKMLRAYMERENRDMKRVDAFQVLSLLSKA